MNLLCAPGSRKYPSVPSDLRVDLFTNSGFKSRGSAGALIAQRIRRAKLNPTQQAWDLMSLALAVVSADHAHHRNGSSDGWTRQIDISVAVSDRAFWNSQSALVEHLLEFLTTDVWRVQFVDGGFAPTKVAGSLPSKEDCVVLLSGGLDSLIGAIDLTAGGHKPLAISHIVRGDGEKQVVFANRLPGGGARLLQLNHNVKVPNPESPPSQRARSIAFLAYGVLAATTLDRYQDSPSTTLYVCENGFIGINPPLTASRVGSLSTRTTHPVVFALFQDLLNAAQLRVLLTNPYRLMTKGEMLAACADQVLLDELASASTSCGRFKQFGYKHCGRCVPCLIRRSAFLKAGRSDTTKYRYEKLSTNNSQRMRFDDVRSAKMGVERARAIGVERWLGAALSSSRVSDVQLLRSMVGRGLDELDVFLSVHNVK